MVSISLLQSKDIVTSLYSHLWPVVDRVDWFNLIWNRFSTPRVSFCAWLLCHDKLPTRSRLKRWGLIQDDVCCFCGTAIETREHLFGSCVPLRPVFVQVFDVMGIPYANYTFADCFLSFQQASKQQGMLYQL